LKLAESAEAATTVSAQEALNELQRRGCAIKPKYPNLSVERLTEQVRKGLRPL
jgi:hypothetical protein